MFMPMAASDSSRKPASAELDILSVLWTDGPSTVRRVHERLSAEKSTGYTTVLKTMQIMKVKGFVSRDESDVAHVYSPAIEPDETRRSFVDELSGKLFGGRAARLALHALASEDISTDELDEISALIAEIRAKD